MVGQTFPVHQRSEKNETDRQFRKLGEIYYINSQRLNLGLFQQDINVIWDLSPHDLSIILFLLEQEPLALSASGMAHINPKIEDVASITLYFENNVIGFVQCSWLDPDKVRRMTVVGSRRMMVYDDIQPSEKLRLYDKSVEKPPYYDSFAEFPYSYKYGDITIPRLDGYEPINNQLMHFIDCIMTDSQPLSNGYNGLQVVRILEAAQESLQDNGRRVEIK